MAIVEPFQKHTSRYEEWFDKNKFAYESELHAVKTLLPRRGRGIEIGVGTGRFAEPLGVCLGLEPSSAMSKVAQERGIQVVEGVAEAVPFGEGHFEFALMVTTLCFLDNAAAALAEIHRVLRPGGVLVIGFVDGDSQLGKKYQRHKQESVFYQRARFYSVGEVLGLLRRSGFRDSKFVQTLFHDTRAIKHVEPVRKGHGEGSFVVIRTEK